MSRNLLVLLLVTHIYEVTNLPRKLKRSSNEVIPLPVSHVPIEHNTILSSRKKKGPTIPSSLSLQVQHQILVPKYHVIPLPNVQHVHENFNHHNRNHSVIPLLIPFHNLVPVHDLTVIPLRRVSEPMVAYRIHNDEDLYRHPLGGYGVGLQFGGHGAGHGFYYSYG